MDLIVAALLFLILGVAGGWMLWGRSAADLRRDRDALDQRLRTSETTLAASEASARELPNLRLLVDGLRDERDAAQRELASLRTVAERTAGVEAALAEERRRAEALASQNSAYVRGEEERQRAYDTQLAQLKDMEARLDARFAELANKALGEAQRQFLERADQRFKQAGEESEAKMKAVLAPVETSLKRYEEGVAKVEDERRKEQGNLAGLIESLRTGQEAVRGEAAKLVNALRAAPKARGRWGEQQLRNVLETCGLAEHTDFQTEVSVAVEDGRLRPDAIIKVPGGRALVVDAKVSLNAYQDAFGAVEDAERAGHLAAHCASMKAHVNGLGNKAYWSQFADAPDYVIMFVPGEHFLSAALEHDPTLWDFAFEKRVLLATPTNLIAIARTVSAVWRQEKMAGEAKAIAAIGKEMYERLAVAAGHLKGVGTGLNRAVEGYNKFVSSFEGRVLVSARRFRDLNVETGPKELEEVGSVDALAREAMVERLPAPAEAAE